MYQFTLQALLNHRKSIEETLQKELSVVKRLLADEKKKLTDYERARNKFLVELQQKQRESITVSENLLYCNFFVRLDSKLDRQRDIVPDIEKNFDRKRDDLIKAMKERKILEKLKEKRLKAYDNKLMKNEQDFLNEAAINMFNRKYLQEE
ncbi:MAG: flagellar export protein FliJ [Deltaproteobacteria bacterium]|nr:flagellar export protein FliJ [Deltaproteobacteria bacterium]